MATCQGCGTEILRHPRERNPRKWCGDACRRRAGRREGRHADLWAPRSAVCVCDCQECARLFVARRAQPAAICPDAECQRLATNRRQSAYLRAGYRRKNPALYARRDALRRARTKEGAESFDPVEIFDRDGWICGICAEPVDPALRFPDPRSRSLDHVRPLARGGRHTRANSRLAHLICNSRRGAARGETVAA